MNCPLCVDAVLDVTHHGGIELDICPRCRGVWLDRGELERLVGDAPAPSSPPQTSAAAPRTTDDGWRDSSGRTENPERPRKNRKRRLAERLGDVFEEVLDL
jgi:uncharacterized protein